MLDALVMTLGFEPGPLVSSVASRTAEGFNQGAKIIVLTPDFPDERAERAWRQLQNIFDMMKLKDLGVNLMKVTIDLSDFTKAVLQVKKVFSELKERKVWISLAGGMRALILITFIAYLLTSWKKPPDIEIFLEGRGMTLKVPSLALVMRPFPDEKRITLLKVMSPGRVYRSSELCALSGKDRSTVYRYLRVLCKTGLVERVGRGFRLTKLGEVLR